MAFDPECMNCRIIRDAPMIAQDACPTHRDRPHADLPMRSAIVARRLHEYFANEAHVGTWGRNYDVVEEEDISRCVVHIMRLLSNAGVTDGN